MSSGEDPSVRAAVPGDPDTAPDAGAEPEDAPVEVPVDDDPDDEPEVEEPVAEPDGDDADDADDADEVLSYPPAVAVVVTRNPGDWFDEVLGGLRDQDYPDLTVLVVDCGSDDDPTARVAAVLPNAFVRRLDASAGFADAANEAMHVVAGATFLLLCHDDVVPDPDALRTMVEEAYRSNAGIVGPKLVAFEEPEVLLEVGRAIDRFGGTFTGIEPGELDQEQHDGVRDAFYIPTATMLVRIDLFEALGGFDPAAFPGAEDLDLCWRARLAGARVLVAPDARVRHREAADDRSRGDRPDVVEVARNRVRVVLTCSSAATLLWLIPIGLLVGSAEAVGDLITRHPRRARAAIGSWLWNLVHFRRLRPARRRAQKARTVHDRDLRELQVKTSTRINAFLAHHLHTDERLRVLEDRSRGAVATVSDRARGPAAVAFGLFLLAVIIGSRDLITTGVPTIGTFAPWPSVGSFFDAFTSAWRFTGLGAASPAPALQVVMGGLGIGALGAVGFASTVVVVGAIPLGAVGAYRFARRVIGMAGPALAAGITYGVNPVPRNAIAAGRLGPLVLFALLPIVLGAAVRWSGLLDVAKPDDRPRGRLLRCALLVALLAAWYPAGIAAVVLGAVALLLVAPFAGEVGASARALGLTVVASLLGIVLLFPWPFAYVVRLTGGSFDLDALGVVYRPVLDLRDVLLFHSGPAGGGVAMWALLVAAAVPLLLADGARLAWAARGWALAFAGWAAVYVPARWFPDVAVPAPEAGLSLAAFGLALALGVGIAVLATGMRSFRFGWRQPAAIIGAIAVVLPALGFVGAVGSGRWEAPAEGWVSRLAFTGEAGEGGFRMLWVGGTDVLPLDPTLLDGGTAYTLTRNGPGDATQLLRAPAGDADDDLTGILDLAAAGRTNRLGRMIGPMGVRYVAVPVTAGPDGGASDPDPTWRRVLDDQLDLARLRTEPGLVLYENLAWLPLTAAVPERTADDVPRGDVDVARAALGLDLSAATAVNGDTTVAPGVLLWGEAYDDAWEATSDGDGLRHFESFGWGNGYTVGSEGSVSVSYSNQWTRWAVLALAALMWIFVALRWWRTRRRSGWLPTEVPLDVLERSPRPDPLSEVLDEDSYWWERV